MTMLRYLDKVVFSYVAQKREDLGMPADFPALLLFDNFSGQCTPYPSHAHCLDSSKFDRLTTASRSECQ